MDYASLPKAELHCHLIGVIDRALLLRAQERGHNPLVDPAHVLSLSPPDLDFVKWLDLVAPYKSASWQVYLHILGAHIENLVRQNVVYTELTVSPLMFAHTHEHLADELRAFRASVDQLAAGRIQVEFLFVIPRSLPADVIERDIARFAIAYSESVICGVSVAGMERGLSLDRLSGMLRTLKEMGLGVVIHAGEHNEADEVWTAIDRLMADRIGHGVTSFKDKELLEYISEKHIHFEFCPTSNLLTDAWTNLDTHPLQRAHQMKLSYSINTDDPGPFACTLTGELALAGKLCGYTKKDYDHLLTSTLSVRFAKRLLPIAEQALIQSKSA